MKFTTNRDAIKTQDLQIYSVSDVYD